MPVNKLEIPVGRDVFLRIYSKTSPMHIVDDAIDHGESRWQLEEGTDYNYEFINKDGTEALDWHLNGPTSLHEKDPLHSSHGRIKTGNFVGTSHFSAFRKDESNSVSVDIEIRSVKTSYREDYQKMLEDIVETYTDLVMQQGAPVTQKFDIDYDAPQRTLYQKFSFVKSIIENEIFDESIHKIVLNPVRKWEETLEERHIESIRRVSRKEIRQIVSRNDRVPISGRIGPLSSFPRYLNVAKKIDSLDTTENQFVKFVLSSFYSFCSNLSSKKNAGEQLKREIKVICNILSKYLNDGFFKGISNLSHFNLGSPALQRKEGYREILQSWLMFDLSAKLAWTGGDRVYDAGKKNVATLYEYWLFFKLLECVSDVFKITPVGKKELVKDEGDSINLCLCQGKTTMIHGSTLVGNRLLNVNLSYNRVFNQASQIEKSGSWTESMRPDYTLSIWPGEMTDKEAESKDTIVHIHFDAKYRIQNNIFSEKDLDDDDLQVEKENQEVGVYKRADLLKMHAYKDAIRRSSGAYILYPGEKNRKPFIGFNEIIPGLGAFCLNPGHESEQIPALKQFITEVVENFNNRISQREKAAMALHEIYSEESDPFYDPFPELFNSALFPDTIGVIVASYSSKKQLLWIKKNQKYAIYLENTKAGKIGLDDVFLNARYLLLYDQKDITNLRILKMTKNRPDIITKEGVRKMNYPSLPSGQLYLVYDVSEDAVEPELKDRPWFIEQLIQEKGNKPFVVKYTNLFPNNLHRNY